MVPFPLDDLLLSAADPAPPSESSHPSPTVLLLLLLRAYCHTLVTPSDQTAPHVSMLLCGPADRTPSAALSIPNLAAGPMLARSTIARIETATTCQKSMARGPKSTVTNAAIGMW